MGQERRLFSEKDAANRPFWGEWEKGRPFWLQNGVSPEFEEDMVFESFLLTLL